jgi:GntR family transcriptional regulator, arabinose operon transcriptional repressor
MPFNTFTISKNADSRGAVRQPKYQQICEYLQREIASGRMAPGSALPTETELCEKMGISRGTVRQAVGQLENEGLVKRIQGSGTFVTTEQQQHAHQQLNMFAFIVPEMRSRVYPSLIHGFEQTCASFQHATIVGNSSNDIGRQIDVIVQFIDQSVGGIALVPATTSPTPPHQIRLLQKQHIPVVLCHRTFSEIAAPSVIYSGREVGLKAGRVLGARGHRRIACVYSHRYSMAEDYTLGLRNALAEIDEDPAGVIFAEYGLALPATLNATGKALDHVLTGILTGPNRPTAIFCGNATDAEAAYLRAIALGLKIPEDLSLIYVGSTWREHGLAGRLCCVAIDEYQIGVRAAQLLHEMRSGQRPLEDDEQFVFPAELLPGETLGPAPGG